MSVLYFHLASIPIMDTQVEVNRESKQFHIVRSLLQRKLATDSVTSSSDVWQWILQNHLQNLLQKYLHSICHRHSKNRLNNDNSKQDKGESCRSLSDSQFPDWFLFASAFSPNGFCSALIPWMLFVCFKFPERFLFATETQEGVCLLPNFLYDFHSFLNFLSNSCSFPNSPHRFVPFRIPNIAKFVSETLVKFCFLTFSIVDFHCIDTPAIQMTNP